VGIPYSEKNAIFVKNSSVNEIFKTTRFIRVLALLAGVVFSTAETPNAWRVDCYGCKY